MKPGSPKQLPLYPMAKLQVSAPFVGLSGRLGGLVYKHYRDKRGVVVSRNPDMSRVKPSPAQLAHRATMRRAAAFHRQVLQDPVLLKKYQRLAQRAGINLSAATMGEVLRGK